MYNFEIRRITLLSTSLSNLFEIYLIFVRFVKFIYIYICTAFKVENNNRCKTDTRLVKVGIRARKLRGNL